MCVNSVQRMLQRFKEMDTEMDVKSRQMETEDDEVQAMTKANFELKCQLMECKLQLERKEFETKRLEREIDWLKEQSKRDSEYYKEQIEWGREQIEWWRKYRAS